MYNCSTGCQLLISLIPVLFLQEEMEELAETEEEILDNQLDENATVEQMEEDYNARGKL